MSIISRPVVDRVAVAGCGIAALAVASQLARSGVHVDIFEAKPELSPLGSGITLQGNALRAFDQMGIWEEVRAKGYAFGDVRLRAPGPEARVLADLPNVKTGGPDYPAAMGMYRPDLAKILGGHATNTGVNMNFHSKVTRFEQDDDGVEVFVNGSSVGRYDLLIGADGINSTVRSQLGIDIEPELTGMGIWRAVVKRPLEVTCSELYYGGPVYIAGYTPTGEDEMYVILVEAAQDRFDIGDEEAHQIMIELSQAYQGPWESIRESLATNHSKVNYTRFTSHIVPGPWNRGRVVIIGDAAHSCPPTIAQGAAQGLEDATVLAELLTTQPALNQQLWDEFHRRRVDRATAVVEASVQLGQWQIDGNREADPGALMTEVAQVMAVPA